MTVGQQKLDSGTLQLACYVFCLIFINWPRHRSMCLCAQGGTTGLVHLYELERGQRPRKIADLEGHEGEINSIKFSNHGDRIVSGGKVCAAPHPPAANMKFHQACACNCVASHGVGWRLCS
jgi:hypothetical protein